MKKKIQLFLLLMVILGEALSLILWIYANAFFIALLIHVTTIGLICFGLYYYRKQGQDLEKHGEYLHAILLTAFFPYIGVLMAIIFLTITSSHPKTAPELFEEYEKLFQDRDNFLIDIDSPTNVLQQVRSEVDFEPFIDIIKGDDSALKKKVIDKLARNVSVQNIKWLRELIDDPSTDVRLCATGSLLKMEGKIHDEIQTAYKNVKEKGDSQQSLYLADLYQMYVNSGLVTGKARQFYLDRACTQYKNALNYTTDKLPVMTRYIRTLLMMNREKEAEKILLEAVKNWPSNKEILLLEAETFFKNKNYHALKKELAHIKNDNLNMDEKEVIEFWIPNS